MDHSEDIVQLPDDIFEAIFHKLSTAVIVHHVGPVCKKWYSIAKDDELWRLRFGLSELPSGFSSWFAYAQRQTMREQALDQLYGRAGVTQNWRKGLQLLGVLADAGDDYAMALYGFTLRRGVGIPRDDQRSTQLLQQSSHIVARALCATFAIGVQRDTNKVYRLLSTECDASDPFVQYLLGECWLLGRGCTQNSAEALRCNEKAGNCLFALSRLGFCFQSGVGAPKDPVRMVQSYRQAAEQGFDVAQYELGVIYANGHGVPPDLQQAEYWIQMAANQGLGAARKWCDEHFLSK